MVLDKTLGNLGSENSQNPPLSITSLFKEVKMEELCKDQPEEFKEYMHYCKGLAFT